MLADDEVGRQGYMATDHDDGVKQRCSATSDIA